MTGDVQSIASDADWISAVQDGQDGEQHPVLQLTLTGTDKNERTAKVTLKSLSNQQVTITVKQRGVSLMSGEEIIPEVTVMNEAFYKDWFKGDNGKVYITESSNKQTWMSRNLPWSENSLGSVPADVAEEIRNHKDDWKLVYSTLGLESTSGANFFTLFNSKLGKLRFFYYIPAGYITISGGAVTASSTGTGTGGGAAIGSGETGSCGTINISSGGIVTATSSKWGAAIGSGYNSVSCGPINISGGNVTATSTGIGAGIGSGKGGNCTGISITGGTVEAAGTSGAGIGSGSDPGTKCGDITITSSVTSVTAKKSDDQTCSIGKGYYASCGTVTIGGVVYPDGITTSPYTYKPNL